MLKHAKHDVGPVGTSGEFTPAPTDGGPSLGSDLKLREINVEGASLVPVRVITEAEPVYHGAPKPAPAPPPVAEAPQAPAPATSAPQAPVAPLPKTASPVPTIGLIGLLSLACGVGLYLFNRRRARCA
jgi:LPXTG-motif cell wall-anchored protein